MSVGNNSQRHDEPPVPNHRVLIGTKPSGSPLFLCRCWRCTNSPSHRNNSTVGRSPRAASSVAVDICAIGVRFIYLMGLSCWAQAAPSGPPVPLPMSLPDNVGSMR